MNKKTDSSLSHVGDAIHPVGRKLLEIILRNIVRAGMKLFPGGESIDQLWFGTKEDIENHEFRVLLRNIQNNLLSIRRDLLISHIPSDQTQSAINAILESNSVATSALSQQLERASPSLLQAIYKFDQFCARGHRPSADLGHLLTICEKELSALRGNLRAQLDSYGRQLTHLDERFDRVQILLSLSTHHKKSELSNLLQEIANSKDFAVLSSFASNVIRAISLAQFGKRNIVTIDFCELYTYAVLEQSVGERLFHVLYFLHQASKPIYLLPGTVIEFEYFLRRHFNELLFPPAQGDSFDQKIMHALSIEKPVERLLDLLRLDKIHYLTDIVELRDPNLEQVSNVFKLLETLRPASEHSNWIDALNLVSLSEMNAIPIDKRGIQRVFHITSSIAVHRAIREFNWYGESGKVAMESSTPIDISPNVYSISTYLMKTTRQKDFDRLKNLSENVVRLAEIQHDVETMSRSVTVERIVSLALSLQQTRSDTERLFNSFASPMFDAILDSCTVHLNDTTPVDRWKNDWELSFSRVMHNLLALMSYLEPASLALKPFLEIYYQAPKATQRKQPSHGKSPRPSSNRTYIER
jgi:hypothetical protein